MVLKSTEALAILDGMEKYLKKALLREWIAQGHHMTGAIVKEAEFVSETVANTLRLDLMIYAYGGIIETGTPAEKIPYSGRTGRGGKSKYITALIGYVQKRMRIGDLKQAKSIAFAIAETQRKKGMPTPGSFKYSSSTAGRTGWIQEVFDSNANAVRDFMYRYVGVIFETRFENMITTYQRKFRE